MADERENLNLKKYKNRSLSHSCNHNRFNTESPYTNSTLSKTKTENICMKNPMKLLIYFGKIVMSKAASIFSISAPPGGEVQVRVLREEL